MFAWLEARTHCHATEDEDRVARSIQFFCPQARMAVARAEGYHKNPILVITARTDSSPAIKDFWRLLMSQRVINDLVELGGKTIDDEWVMHLRFGKQEAFMGKAVLVNQEDAISVRLKIARQPPRNRDAFQVAKHTIEELVGDYVPHT